MFRTLTETGAASDKKGCKNKHLKKARARFPFCTMRVRTIATDVELKGAMMKLRILVLPMVVIAASVSACSNANFGSDGGKKRAGQDVLPAGGLQNPENAPLDISEDEKNKYVNGPKAGEKELTGKTIELDCDNSQGIIIDVGANPPPAGKGDETPFLLIGGDGKDDKGGKGVDLDTSGKPIDGGKGGKDDGKGGGKDDLPVDPPVVVPEQAKVTAKVKGQFCPQSKNRLTVLFIVDYSGSMGRHVPENGGAELPGNDPQIGGSCGRLRAAQAILSKIRAEKAPTDIVDVAMVPFAGGVVTNRVIKLMDLASFDALVSKDTFCQYVIQDPSFGVDPINPGGIVGPSGLFGIGAVDSSTNYRAAFTAGQTMLQGVYGRKVAYFISDGQPTSGGIDPVQAGIDAGRSMRAAVDNLVLNGLLLGNVGPEAKAVLDQVTGSAARVRHAENADQLAREIIAFPEASIDPQSGRATLTVAPYPVAELGLRYLSPDPARPGVWLYETQPFVLLGKPGVETLNVVDVMAKGVDGSTHSAQVVIRYRQ